MALCRVDWKQNKQMGAEGFLAEFSRKGAIKTAVLRSKPRKSLRNKREALSRAHMHMHMKKIGKSYLILKVHSSIVIADISACGFLECFMWLFCTHLCRNDSLLYISGAGSLLSAIKEFHTVIYSCNFDLSVFHALQHNWALLSWWKNELLRVFTNNSATGFLQRATLSLMLIADHHVFIIRFQRCNWRARAWTYPSTDPGSALWPCSYP